MFAPITALVDAAPAPVDAVDAFAGSTQSEWGALRLSGLDRDGRFSPNLGCFLVSWNGELILCDAGIGPGPNAYLGGLQGGLLAELARYEVEPDQIDAVIFTHLHMDHLGWASLPDARGGRAPTFPNADYVVAAPELAYWSAGAQGARAHHRDAFETIFQPLVRAGQVTALPVEEPIRPGLALMSTPGHTPGHASICFRQGNDRLVIAGDIFHCPGQVERPDWGHRADMDPGQAQATRRRFIEDATRESWVVGAGHFRDGLQLGTIVSSAKSHAFIAHPARQSDAAAPPYHSSRETKHEKAAS